MDETIHLVAKKSVVILGEIVRVVLVLVGIRGVEDRGFELHSGI